MDEFVTEILSSRTQLKFANLSGNNLERLKQRSKTDLRRSVLVSNHQHGFPLAPEILE